MDSIAGDWQRIETWLQAHAPRVLPGLNPGVAEEELRQKEAAIRVPLPEDFKASYRLHNGSRSRYALMGCSDFYPLSGVVGGEEGVYYDLLQDPSWAEQEPGCLTDLLHPPLLIQPVWRHPLWLNFAVGGGDEEWCLDLAPARDGQVGQIMTWHHEDGPERVLFPSFAALLSTYADGLEAGLFLGKTPVFSIEQLTHLQARRQAFQEPSPAKPLLWQAIELAWAGARQNEDLAAFRQILHREEATAEDRFFAYYGLISLRIASGHFDEAFSAFAQWEVEAQELPATHWVHEEVALLRTPLRR